jgi:hypothetical protein
MSLAPLYQYQALMRGFHAPWCIGGGWACDAWAGRKSRDHADVDIVIWRQDQTAFRSCFADWQWQTFLKGAQQPWLAHTRLELPAHNAHGQNGEQTMEVLMIEREGDRWWYRRNPQVRMPASEAMLITSAGLPVLNPAIALLFKSKRVEDKDQHDLETVLPAMRPQDRRWLKQALLAADPDHEWIDRL